MPDYQESKPDDEPPADRYQLELKRHGRRRRRTHEEKDETESKAEHDGTCEISVVHDALVWFGEGVEDGEGFGEYVSWVDSEFWRVRSVAEEERRKEVSST